MPDDKKSNDANVNVSIGGSVSGRVNVAGRDLHVTENALDAEALAKLFEAMNRQLDSLPNAAPQDIADARSDIQSIQDEAAKGDQADEGAVARHLRSIARMGPEILDVVTATLANPAAGIALVIRKIAQKAREDAGLS